LSHVFQSIANHVARQIARIELASAEPDPGWRIKKQNLRAKDAKCRIRFGRQNKSLNGIRGNHGIII
jgi:hypothetical protein